MSATAFKRDLADWKTITDFVAQVQSVDPDTAIDSDLTQPAAAPSDVVRGLFVAVWLAQAILAAHVIHSAVRVLTAYQRSAR